MIEGISITQRRIIPDDRGKIMHIMKQSDPQFNSFGEVYCSTVYPGIVKGWHLHEKMTLNYLVLKGNIKFVLYASYIAEQTIIVDKISKKEGIDFFVQYQNVQQLINSANDLLEI